MKVIDLFKNNPNKVIVEYHGGVARGFESFEKYAEYLDNYYGDVVVQKIIFNDLKELKGGPGHQSKSNVTYLEDFTIYVNEFNIVDDANRMYQSHYFYYEVKEIGR